MYKSPFIVLFDHDVFFVTTVISCIGVVELLSGTTSKSPLLKSSTSFPELFTFELYIYTSLFELSHIYI